MRLAPLFLKRQFMLWLLGRAVPQAPLLMPLLRVGIIGLAAAIAVGSLFTLGCLGLLASFYMYMEAQKVEPATACLIISFTTFMLGGIVFAIAQRIFNRRVEVIQPAPMNGQPIQLDEMFTEIPRVLVTNFLHGVMGDSHANPSKTS